MCNFVALFIHVSLVSSVTAGTHRRSFFVLGDVHCDAVCNAGSVVSSGDLAPGNNRLSPLMVG